MNMQTTGLACPVLNLIGVEMLPFNTYRGSMHTARIIKANIVIAYQLFIDTVRVALDLILPVLVKKWVVIYSMCTVSGQHERKTSYIVY